MIGPTSHHYFSQGLRLHYVDWGNEQAPPLLLVHGGNDHCRSWDWLAPRLADRFHIIAPDLRGHGNSAHAAGGGYLPHAFVLDLAQLVAQQHLAPVNILAHSWGGAVSLTYAGTYPEQVARLMVVEGWAPSPEFIESQARLGPDERMRRWVDDTRAVAHRRPPRYASLAECAQRIQAANRRLSPEQARHLAVHASLLNEDGTYSWKFDPYTRVREPIWQGVEEMIGYWSRITCPTLLVRGQDSETSDPFTPDRLRHFRNARVETLSDAGHWAHHDRLDSVVEMAQAFF